MDRWINVIERAAQSGVLTQEQRALVARAVFQLNRTASSGWRWTDTNQRASAYARYGRELLANAN